MKERYILSKHGGLSLFEQAAMTAEERAWWVKEIERENKEQQEQHRVQQARMPRMPSRRRR